MNLKLTFLLLVVCCTTAFAQEKIKVEQDTLLDRQTFELSFGQSLLFISNSKLVDIRNERAVVVPTNALLLLAELRSNKKFRIPLFFNLATETKQFLVNNQLVNEKASPTFGAGIQYKLFQIPIDAKSKIEFEIGPLASILFTKANEVRFAPIIVCRLKILRGENFTMYLGTSYSLGINSWGLLYGTGTSF